MRIPLHFAASGPYPGMIRLLLEHGADINAAENADSFTPLMYAAAEGHLEVVKTLVGFGADPALKDKDGDTAEAFAVWGRANDFPADLRRFVFHSARICNICGIDEAAYSVE